jgi:hypothetical protein
MASASTSENVTALTRAAIKHARGRSAGVVDGYGGWRPAGDRRFRPPIEIYDCVAPPSSAHPKVKQAPLMSVSNATITVQDEPVREPSSFNTSITLAGRAADPHRPHPCDDDGRLAVAVALTGVIKQSLLEWAGDLVTAK